jgi:hypothetical protein
MRPLQRLRYALADLRFRTATTFLGIVTIQLAIFFLLGLGFYARIVWAYQTSLVNEAALTQIVATCPDLTATRLRFTDPVLATIRDLPEGPVAFPKVEVGTTLSIKDGARVAVPLEGTIAADPGFAASRLAWGSPVSDRGQYEAVLPQALFCKIGGSLTADGPRPQKLVLEVSRTVDGKAETLTLTLRLVGLLRHHPGDKVFVPLSLAVHLDQWCAHQLATLPSIDGKADLPAVSYEAILAYGPREHQDRIDQEAAMLQANVHRVGEVTVLETAADIWARVAGQQTEAAARQLPILLARAGAGTSFAVRVIQINNTTAKGRVVGLPLDDPRWSCAPDGKAPAFGTLLAARDNSSGGLNAPGVFLPKAGIASGLPGGGDWYGTLETLSWLAFDISSCPLVAVQTLFRTTDREQARIWARTLPGQVQADQPIAWEILDIEKPLNAPRSGAVRSEQETGTPADVLMERVKQAAPDGSVGFVRTGRVKLIRRGAPPVDVPARFLPDELFRLLRRGADRQSTSGPRADGVACIRVGPAAELCRAGLVNDVEVEVVQTLPGADDQWWFRQSDRAVVCPSAHKSGVARWGSWDEMTDLRPVLEASRLPVREVLARRPTRFAVRIAGPAEAAARQLGAIDRHTTLTQLQTVPVTAITADRSFPAWAALADTVTTIGASGTISIVERDPEPGRIRLAVAANPVVEVSAAQADSPHPELLMVDPAAFRRLAFEAARAGRQLPPFAESELAVQVADTRFLSLRAALASAGLTLQPLTPLREQKLIQYRVESRTGKGRASADLAAALDMARPTFVGAVPILTVPARIVGQQVLLSGSSATDPRRFEAGLRHGRWLPSSASGHDAVLPLALAGQLFPGQAPEAGLDQEIAVRFIRDQRIAHSEPALTLRLRLAGWVDGPGGFAPLELLHQLTLWSQGKVLYNDSRHTFDTPAQIYERSGQVRCNVYAPRLEAVAPLVARLEEMGYRVEHHLAEQEGLGRLARVLVFLVALFGGGFLAKAWITVLTTAAMSIATKTHEIGILRSLGLQARQIVSIFALQGMILGLAAFVGGTLLSVVLEPLFTRLIHDTFHLPADAIPIHLASASNWPLFVLALALAIMAGLTGAVLPALRACRLSPAQAFQHRD